MRLKNRYTEKLPQITPSMLQVHHYRIRDNRGIVLAKGGTTEVTLLTPDHGDVVGVAWCTPEDHYTRRIGYAIAFGKATKIWAQLREGKNVPLRRELKTKVVTHH